MSDDAQNVSSRLMDVVIGAAGLAVLLLSTIILLAPFILLLALSYWLVKQA